jgi:inorganic triphosphatase YgiF
VTAPDIGEHLETEPVETELKLSVSMPRRIARLIRELEGANLGSFRPEGPPQHVVIVDRYLDTALSGGRLQQRAMRARLRQRGRSVTLTVKRSGTARTDGISARVELEGRATAALDPHRWPASPARAALLEAIGDEPLVEIGRLRQDRLVRIVRGDGAAMELSLDRVDALVDGRVGARRFELEAELKHGAETALTALGQELARVRGLGPPAGSKLAFAVEARASTRGPNTRLVDSRPR